VIKAHLCYQGIGFYQQGSPFYELYLACELITPDMLQGLFITQGTSFDCKHFGYLELEACTLRSYTKQV